MLTNALPSTGIGIVSLANLHVEMQRPSIPKGGISCRSHAILHGVSASTKIAIADGRSFQTIHVLTLFPSPCQLDKRLSPFKSHGLHFHRQSSHLHGEP